MSLVTSGAGHKWRAIVENGVLLETPSADCPEHLARTLMMQAWFSDRWEQQLVEAARRGEWVDTSGT